MRCTQLAARALAATCALAAGCNLPEAGSFSVEGTAGTALPETGSVVALWEVKDPEPAYFYKYGEAPLATRSFSLDWPEDPPAEAIDASGIGVAIFVLLPGGTTIPEGKVSLSALSVRGI